MTTDAFEIRRACEDDLTAINALMHSSSAYKGDYYVIIEGYNVSHTDLETKEVHVADRGGTLMGFYSLLIQYDVADLDLMFVSDAAQGSGIGRALFDHMKETAKQSGRTAVMIGAHPPAVGFYERMGAVRCGVSPPIPRVTWERPLLKLAIEEN